MTKLVEAIEQGNEEVTKNLHLEQIFPRLAKYVQEQAAQEEENQDYEIIEECDVTDVEGLTIEELSEELGPEETIQEAVETTVISRRDYVSEQTDSQLSQPTNKEIPENVEPRNQPSIDDSIELSAPDLTGPYDGLTPIGVQTFTIGTTKIAKMIGEKDRMQKHELETITRTCMRSSNPKPADTYEARVINAFYSIYNFAQDSDFIAAVSETFLEEEQRNGIRDALIITTAYEYIRRIYDVAFEFKNMPFEERARPQNNPMLIALKEMDQACEDNPYRYHKRAFYFLKKAVLEEIDRKYVKALAHEPVKYNEDLPYPSVSDEASCRSHSDTEQKVPGKLDNAANFA